MMTKIIIFIELYLQGMYCTVLSTVSVGLSVTSQNKPPAHIYKNNHNVYQGYRVLIMKNTAKTFPQCERHVLTSYTTTPIIKRQILNLLLFLSHVSDHPSLTFHSLTFVWRTEVFHPSFPCISMATMTSTTDFDNAEITQQYSRINTRFELSDEELDNDHSSARLFERSRIKALAGGSCDIKLNICCFCLYIQRPTNVHMHTAYTHPHPYNDI